MAKKPWPIIILATLHFIEPLLKILFYSAYWQVSPLQLVQHVVERESTLSAILFFGAFPLGGLAIISVKKWSLPVYLAVQSLVLSHNFSDWLYNEHAVPLTFLVMVTALNLTVVAYFLVPAVRLAYMDPNLRWWEALPRYRVNFPAKLTQLPIEKLGVHIRDISEGGVLLAIHPRAELDLTQPLDITFNFEIYDFKLSGDVRHQRIEKAPSGKERLLLAGLQFSDLNSSATRDLKQCLNLLRRRGFPTRHDNDYSMYSLWTWIKTLGKTGKEIIAENEEIRKIP